MVLWAATRIPRTRLIRQWEGIDHDFCDSSGAVKLYIMSMAMNWPTHGILIQADLQ